MQKLLQFAAMFALLFGLASQAKAYRVIVVDPPPYTDPSQGVPVSYPITDSNPTIPAQWCDSALNSNIGSYQSCFYGVNYLPNNETITELQVVLPTLAGGDPECAAFNNTSGMSCVVTGPNGGGYLLDFTGLDFTSASGVIIGIDAPESDFPDGLTFTVLDVTPEPESIWLLSTGVMTSAGLYFRRRTLLK